MCPSIPHVHSSPVEDAISADREKWSPILQEVVEWNNAPTNDGRPPVWARYSEGHYWHTLISQRPFQVVYPEPTGLQSLLHSDNLSLTPREECERHGLCEPTPLPGPGQAVVLHSLVAAAHHNGQRGRTLPLSGPGASQQKQGRHTVAVRLERGGAVVVVLLRNVHAVHTPLDGALPPHVLQYQSSCDGHEDWSWRLADRGMGCVASWCAPVPREQPKGWGLFGVRHREVRNGCGDKRPVLTHRGGPKVCSTAAEQRGCVGTRMPELQSSVLFLPLPPF